MIEITEDNVKEFIGPGKTSVIDFYADWCGPCRACAPKFKEIAEKHGESAVFAKCDADSCSSILREHRVSSLPTFIVFKDGREKARFVGMPPEQAIVDAIREG